MTNPHSGESASDGGTAMRIVVEFDRSLLSHFSVSAWNDFIDGLMAMNLTPITWSPGERPPPLGVLLDFSRLQRAHYRLDGIDLSMCWLEDADFTGASLKGARLGCGKNVSYRQARLDLADFSDGVEISGCDFTDATGLETALFDGASYGLADQPKGLPPEILAVCKAKADAPPADPQKVSAPRHLSEVPLRACVTIHATPMG